MEKISEQLVTRDQLENIYTAWGTKASVPGANKKELVYWPNKEHAEIIKTKLKNDYGKALYKIEFFRH